MKSDAQIAPRGKIVSIRRSKEPRGRGWKYDPKSGLYVKRHAAKNMIVLAGLSMAAKSIQYGNSDEGKTIRYLAVGTGYALPASNQTALVNEAERAEIESWDNTDIGDDPVVMVASKLFLTSEANGSLMECGLFQESSGPPMYCRGLFGWGQIDGITKANPTVVTAPAHGLDDGDKILIENVSGMTEVNGLQFYIDVLSGDTFALYTDENLTTPVDSSAYGTYSEASPDLDTWKLVIPKTTSETFTVNYSLTYPAE